MRSSKDHSKAPYDAPSISNSWCVQVAVASRRRAQATQATPATRVGEVPKPKGPRTAYNLFFRDQQEQINQMKLLNTRRSVNAAAIVSDRWKELKPSIKARYHQMAADDKFRYYKEKREYSEYQERMAREAEVNEPIPLNRGASLSTLELPIVPRDYREYSTGVPITTGFTHEDMGATCMPTEHDGDMYAHLCSRESIARLASQLDDESIDFLIRVFRNSPS